MTNAKVFWDCNRFTTKHNFSVFYLNELGGSATEYYSYDSADLNNVIEYLMRLVASCTADEIMVRQDNYTYLEPWFNVLKTSLVNKNYSYANDLTYKGV